LDKSHVTQSLITERQMLRTVSYQTVKPRHFYDENTKDEYGCCDKDYRHDGMKRLPKESEYRIVWCQIVTVGFERTESDVKEND